VCDPKRSPPSAVAGDRNDPRTGTPCLPRLFAIDASSPPEVLPSGGRLLRDPSRHGIVDKDRIRLSLLWFVVIPNLAAGCPKEGDKRVMLLFSRP